MQLPLVRRLRDRGVRADDLGVDGTGKRLEQCLRPAVIGGKAPLLRPDARSDDPIARGEMGRQSAGDSKTDDSRSAALGPRAMRASIARQVTATTCPLVDIQRSFCLRSAAR